MYSSLTRTVCVCSQHNGKFLSRTCALCEHLFVFVLRTFYAEINSQDMSSGPAILESFCHSLVRDKDKWNQYQTYLLNMEQGQRILSQYGGTFFQVCWNTYLISVITVGRWPT